MHGHIQVKYVKKNVFLRQEQAEVDLNHLLAGSKENVGSFVEGSELFL